MGLKMSFFCHFPKFGLLVFPKIDYSDSLQQRLTTSRGDPEKIILEAQIWPKPTKLGLKISFFWHFFKFGSLAFLDIEQDDSLQH